MILTHTVRRVAELAYADRLARELPQHEFLGEEVREKLVYYPTVTGEPFHTPGRITDLIRSGRLFDGSRPAGDRPGARPGHAVRQHADAGRGCGAA